MKYENLKKTIIVCLAVSVVLTFLLLVKSSMDFSRSGPQIKAEILEHFKVYVVYAMARLGFWTLVLFSFLASIGLFFYNCLLVILKQRFSYFFAVVTALFFVGLMTVLAFSHTLLYSPSTIVASFLYRVSRLYPLWELLSPERLNLIYVVLFFVYGAITLIALSRLVRSRDIYAVFIGFFYILTLSGSVCWSTVYLEPETALPAASRNSDKPNIIMIGSDTLRMDRLGAAGYHRNLTPNIDMLGSSGGNFTNSYVSLARTAPSLVSFMTGTWIHKHGYRDNYIADDEIDIPVVTLPQVLKKSGYNTAVIADWAGGDLGKLNFGFDSKDTSPDQWNLKYLMRQGPKDIRLFLSLFSHNRLGKIFLPEIYYLAGTPLNDRLLHDTKQKLNDLSNSAAPFFLTVFSASTHMPFSPEYPYYKMYADPDYNGESRFCISGLSTPEEIIDKQGKGKADFDYQQIVDLYDGAVKSFDDFVGQIVRQISANGIAENTIIVIFSDHGTELFEQDVWGQGNTVVGGDFSLRVPLVIYDPRRAANGSVEKTTRSVDVMPTLLELAGLPVPDSVDGVSLLPYLNDAQSDLGLLAFAETGLWLAKLPGIKEKHLTYPNVLTMVEVKDKSTGTLSVKAEYQDLVVRAKDRMVRDDKWKLVYMPMTDGAFFQLFDVSSDKQSAVDVSAEYPEIFQQLKSEMINWLTSEPEWIYQDGHVVRMASKQDKEVIDFADEAETESLNHARLNDVKR